MLSQFDDAKNERMSRLVFFRHEYEENGMFKYTVGASTDYQEIYQLRKSLSERFPEAFIIAFKDGRRANVQQAIQEYRRNKNKK